MLIVGLIATIIFGIISLFWLFVALLDTFVQHEYSEALQSLIRAVHNGLALAVSICLLIVSL